MVIQFIDLRHSHYCEQSEHIFKTVFLINHATLWQEFMMQYAIAVEKTLSKNNRFSIKIKSFIDEENYSLAPVFEPGAALTHFRKTHQSVRQKLGNIMGLVHENRYKKSIIA